MLPGEACLGLVGVGGLHATGCGMNTECADGRFGLHATGCRMLRVVGLHATGVWRRLYVSVRYAFAPLNSDVTCGMLTPSSPP